MYFISSAIYVICICTIFWTPYCLSVEGYFVSSDGYFLSSEFVIVSFSNSIARIFLKAYHNIPLKILLRLNENESIWQTNISAMTTLHFTDLGAWLEGKGMLLSSRDTVFKIQNPYFWLFSCGQKSYSFVSKLLFDEQIGIMQNGLRRIHSHTFFIAEE